MNRMELRARAEAMIEELIGILDQIDGDCDLEYDGTAEPWLGWTRTGAIGNRHDLELDLSDEGEPDYAA